MKKLCAVIVVAVLGIVVCGAENLMKTAGVSYQVFPGDWNKKLQNDKNLGKFIDPDLDRVSGKRKGLLADGKTEQRGICYNYHWTLKNLRFVTIVVDLGKEQEISGLKLVAFQNNEAYKPSFFEVAASSDNVSYRDIAKGDQWETQKRYLRVAQVAVKDTKCRYLRIKIGTAVAWINISEIEVYGK